MAAMIASEPRALSLIRRVPLFQGAPDADALARGAQFRDLRKGEHLFWENDPASHLYAVERGWLKVFKRSPRGDRELTLHLEGPRQVVAEATVFVDGARFSANCAALEDATVLCLPAALVRQVVARSPTLAQAVIAHFARRQGDLIHRVERLVFHELGARLAAHLLEHTGACASYRLPPNSELASQLGTVPELVSRKLGEFYRQGYIQLQGRELRVLNEPALSELAGGR